MRDPNLRSRVFIRSAAQTGLAIGFARLAVRGASPLEIVFHLMHTELVSYTNPSQYVRNEVLEDVNDHHRVVFIEVPLGHNRSFLNALVFKKLSDSPPSYLWVAAPRRSHKGIIKQAQDRHTIRGELIRCVRLTASASGITHPNPKLDLKRRIPRWLAEKHVTPAMMRLPLAPAASHPAGTSCRCGHPAAAMRWTAPSLARC